MSEGFRMKYRTWARLCPVKRKGKAYPRSVPENDDESWQNVPYANWNRDNTRVKLNANWHSNDDSNYSVPVLRESSPRQRTPRGVL